VLRNCLCGGTQKEVGRRVVIRYRPYEVGDIKAEKHEKRKRRQLGGALDEPEKWDLAQGSAGILLRSRRNLGIRMIRNVISAQTEMDIQKIIVGFGESRHLNNNDCYLGIHIYIYTFRTCRISAFSLYAVCPRVIVVQSCIRCAHSSRINSLRVLFFNAPCLAIQLARQPSVPDNLQFRTVRLRVCNCHHQPPPI
jgi:hypothetical protein